jgi:quercetin dioxygenase-like cupin family protein
MREPGSMSQTIICRAAGRPAHVQQLGAYRIEPLIERQEENSGTAYRVQIAPNQHTATSYHAEAEEYYYVLSGSGSVILDGEEHSLTTGHFLRLPPGTRHAFVAGEKGLEMLDIHTPGCWPDRDTFFVDAVPGSRKESP